MAGRYDKKVKAILGQDIWQMLERSVKNGVVDARKMQDIAYKLHQEVGGGHLLRMGPGMKGVPDWFEFREILGHWYEVELYQFEENPEPALKKLSTILKSEEVGLLNLAVKLQRTHPGALKKKICKRFGLGLWEIIVILATTAQHFQEKQVLMIQRKLCPRYNPSSSSRSAPFSSVASCTSSWSPARRRSC